MATTFVIDATASRALEGERAHKLVVGALTTDGSDGASAGDILATIFGFSFLAEVSPLVKSDNTIIVVAAPAYNGASLLGKAAATAAAADIPSGTYRCTVRGY